MIFLRNDYSEGMHPKILEAIIRTNETQELGYCEDSYTKNACELIKKRINKPNSDVYLLCGGTQVNKTALAAFLRPFEAVIATQWGHICVHEAGAIEATGHKILEQPSKDGKLSVELIQKTVDVHTDEHMVSPKVVYISTVTELGTVYTKEELLAISECCKKNDLYLYIDGARLANALTCDICDITIEELADLCDAFYIGGTKNGAMLGEAIVINNEKLKPNFLHYMRQNAALMAKGRVLGVQFEAMFTDDLFLKIAKHTNEVAKYLADEVRKLGFEFVAEPESNMVFVILPNEINEELSKYCHYEAEFPHDENSMEARFVTSFATPKEDIDKFIKVLEDIKTKLTK